MCVCTHKHYHLLQAQVDEALKRADEMIEDYRKERRQAHVGQILDGAKRMVHLKLFVYVYTYVYIYIYTHMYIYIYMYTHPYVYTYTRG